MEELEIKFRMGKRVAEHEVVGRIWIENVRGLQYKYDISERVTEPVGRWNLSEMQDYTYLNFYTIVNLI